MIDADLCGEIDDSTPRKVTDSHPVDINDPDTFLSEMKKRVDELAGVAGHLCADFDAVKGGVADLSKEQLRRAVLYFDEAKDHIEELKRVRNRNAQPLERRLASHILDEDTDEEVVDGVSYRVEGSGYYSAPNLNEKEKYTELVNWLFEDAELPDRLESVPTNYIRISDSQLNRLCQRRMKEGQPMPPHVKSYPFVTVKVKR